MTPGGWGACLGLRNGFGVRWPQGGGRGGCAWVTQGCRAGCRGCKQGMRGKGLSPCPGWDALQGRATSGGGDVGVLYLCKCAPEGCVRDRLQLCTGTEGPLLAQLQLSSASQPLLPGDPPKPCSQPTQPNPTQPTSSAAARQMASPVAAPMGMGPAALHDSAWCCWQCAGTIPRAEPWGDLPCWFSPPRDLSSLLSVAVSAAKLASCTRDAAAANRAGLGGDARGCIQSWI